MSDEDGALEILPEKESYELRDEQLKIEQVYDISEFNKTEREEIKGLFRQKLKEAVEDMKRIHEENFDYDISSVDDAGDYRLALTAETGREIGLDMIASTTSHSYMHESPRNAYRFILQMKQQIERHFTPKIVDLMNSKEHQRE